MTRLQQGGAPEVRWDLWILDLRYGFEASLQFIVRSRVPFQIRSLERGVNVGGVAKYC